jgi:single-strand DNA-binding protein
MANEFRGRGNLGQDPELRNVEVEGEARQVCALRIYFDRQVPNGEEFEDRGGFWLDADLWGPRAEDAARVLRKGMRLYVEGSLAQHTWKDKETGGDRARLTLRADYLALDLGRLESVVLRARSADLFEPAAG